MALGGKKKVRSSNELIIENDDESVKSGFEDAREIPVSKTPNLNLLSNINQKVMSTKKYC